MKRLFKFKYPKLLGLVIAIFLAYYLFSNPAVEGAVNHLGNLSYFGIFIAGMLFSFGFSAPFAAGFFIALRPENIWLAAAIGGFGAMLSDLFIFDFIRFSFMDEFNRIRRGGLSRRLKSILSNTLGNRIRIYLMYVFAGILIASPLPDEAGVIMLAGLTKIKAMLLAVVGFVLNTIGILVLLSL